MVGKTKTWNGLFDTLSGWKDQDLEWSFRHFKWLERPRLGMVFSFDNTSCCPHDEAPVILAGGHVRNRGPRRLCVCVCVSEKKLFYYDTNRKQVCFCRQVATRHWSERQANLALLSLDRAATVQTYRPTKKVSIFQF